MGRESAVTVAAHEHAGPSSRSGGFASMAIPLMDCVQVQGDKLEAVVVGIGGGWGVKMPWSSRGGLSEQGCGEGGLRVMCHRGGPRCVEYGCLWVA